MEVTASLGDQTISLQIRKNANADEVLHAAREHFGEEVTLKDMRRLQNGSVRVCVCVCVAFLLSAVSSLRCPSFSLHAQIVLELEGSD